MSRQFLLAKDEAVREARDVARVVDGWKDHFAKYAVSPGDIDLYAEQIDRPFLKNQRSELLASRRGR
jgi:serine/threonine-protein kinase HipA